MTDIRELTAGYVTAFNARELEQVARYLSEEFELTDPEVTALTPKKSVLDYIRKLFGAHNSLSFKANMILAEGDKSVIHFTLILDKLVLDGVDVITWKDGQMTNMKAYLTLRK
jgi:predicted SnoaL-like aldol condensation-catalyzing enzyme